ncbi:MAG: DUF6338 family protein [Alphaproteobacteria bacterium]|nr:DUF6338 family protein [Alphaproteobacteria bacterium]
MTGEADIMISGTVGVLTYLLPGLIAAATFYALTSHPKPTTFERVVQALVFTVLAQVISEQVLQLIQLLVAQSVIQGLESWKTIVSVVIAVFLAILATYISNNDILHRILRRLGVTKETSHPSEWYSAFARKDPRYVVLHLNDRRRVYGWPEEWPSRSDQGHFRLAEPTWLDQERESVESSVSDILIPAEDVHMVEFLRHHTSDEGE